MAIISNAVTIADAGAFSASLGSLTHIKTLTASSSSTLSFVHGSSSVILDNTHPIYKFEFVELHPGGNNVDFTFNMSIDSGSNYNVAKTSTFFQAERSESGGGQLAYSTSDDSSQATGFQILSDAVGNDNDTSVNGFLTLFNPASTTFAKHFASRADGMYNSSYIVDCHCGGYANTTSAVNAVQFKFASGNIDSGKIQLYGIKDS